MSPSNTVFRVHWREVLLVAIILTSLVVILNLPPIPQDQAYHDFADKREFWSIRNFFDVISNLPFLVVGVFGLHICWHREDLDARPAWLTLFGSVALVSIGSSYYHWAPGNQTLVWDRLPMAIAFMALMTALLADYLDRRCIWLLLPLVSLGVFGVLYWHWTDDLRLYAWVQFFPLMCVVILLALYKPGSTRPGYLLVALGVYLLSKLFEWADQTVFYFLGGQLSGHSVKHVLAALAALCLVLMLRAPATSMRSHENADPA